MGGLKNTSTFRGSWAFQVLSQDPILWKPGSLVNHNSGLSPSQQHYFTWGSAGLTRAIGNVIQNRWVYSCQHNRLERIPRKLLTLV